MKHFFFLITQLFWFTSDDGLGHFERKRMAEEHHKAMREPLPPQYQELLRKWKEQKNNESN